MEQSNVCLPGINLWELASIKITGNAHTEPMPARQAPAEAILLPQDQRDAITQIIFDENLKLWTEEAKVNKDRYIEMSSEVWNYLSTESQNMVKDSVN